MSLDKADAVPVDTHVWQIAKRDYKCAAGSAQKTLTDKVHRDIGQHQVTNFNRLKKNVAQLSKNMPLISNVFFFIQGIFSGSYGVLMLAGHNR